MKLFSYLVHTELYKIDRFSNELLVDFGPMVKMETTLKIIFRAAKNLKTQLWEKGLERMEAGEKRNLEGSSRSNNKGRLLKSNLDGKYSGGSGEAKWCKKCKKKHFGRCDEEVT